MRDSNAAKALRRAFRCSCQLLPRFWAPAVAAEDELGTDIEREIYFKSHISLWEHSSHFRLPGSGVPSVSVVSQLMYKFLCLASPKENPQVPM